MAGARQVEPVATAQAGLIQTGVLSASARSSGWWASRAPATRRLPHRYPPVRARVSRTLATGVNDESEDDTWDSEPSDRVGRLVAAVARVPLSLPAPRCPFELGRFRMNHELGRGGMARVYAATDLLLGREVAIKVARERDERAHARLLAEARAVVRVRHPNVVSLFSVEEVEGSVLLVMELLTGGNLLEYLSASGIPEPRVAEALVLQLTSAVAVAHEAGIVHRDIKPSNVLLTTSGDAKLSDFGIASVVERDELLPIGPTGLTGAFRVGTPRYMAPEVLERGRPTPASDVFSLSLLLTELLVGLGFHRPDDGPEELPRVRAEGTLPPHVLSQLRDYPAPRLRALASVLERGTACSPEDRYPNGAALFAAVKEALDAVPEARRDGSQRYETGFSSNVPLARSRLFGRDEERAELSGLFRGTTRLVTLLGPVGVGKSAVAASVAQELARELPGGAWRCDLTRARSVTDIARAVALSLDLPLVDRDPLDQLERALRSLGAALLVLDGADGVIESLPAILARWTRAAPELRVLVTSREPLAIASAETRSLPPLRTDDAVAFFLDAARRVGVRPLDDEQPAVEALVHRLDRLPLAIELSSARLWNEPLEALLQTDGPIESLADVRRVGSLRRSVDRGLDAVSGERALLVGLTTFEGGGDLRAFERFAAHLEVREAPLEVLARLVDRNLLQLSEPVPGVVRFEMPAWVRERLREAPSSPEQRRWHREYFARFAAEETARVGGPGGREALRRLALERGNVLVALRSAVEAREGAAVASCVRALGELYEHRGPFDEGYAQLAGLRTEVDDDEARMAFETVLARLARLSGRPGAAEDHARLAQRLGAPEGSLELARLRHDAGRLGEAVVLYDAAIEAFTRGGDRVGRGLALALLGSAHVFADRLAEADACLTEAVECLAGGGDWRHEGYAWVELGHLRWLEGDLAQGLECYERALLLSRRVGDHRQAARVLDAIGTHHFESGELEAARHEHELALEAFERSGDATGRAQALDNLASVYAALGEREPAERCYRQAIATHRTLDDPRRVSIVEGNLGRLLGEEGRLEEARELLERSVARSEETYPLAAGVFRGALAWIEALDGDARKALELIGVAEPVVRRGSAVELGKLFCVRARIEARVGETAAAHASLAEATAIASRLGVGSRSELGRALVLARSDVSPDSNEP